jgi:hypothetical protein
VVIYVLDELPIVSLMDERGRIDRSRFPNTARFADDATWYRNTLSPAWTTTEAVPAILTGKRPVTGRVPINVDHPENVFTLLREQYDENVIESYTRLCPLAVCPNESPTLQRAVSLVSALSLTYLTVAAPRVLERRLPNPGNTWSAVLAALDPHRRIDPDDFETGDLRLFPGQQFERFASSVRRPRAGARPPLYFLHASLPHSPYVYVPDGRVYRDHNKEAPGFDVASDQWENDGGAVQAGWQRHLLQTQFADRTLGRLMRRLESEGLYEDALVVVVADHGASFIPGSNRRRPRAANLSDISMVPFFVKPPGRGAGRVEDRPMSTLDVLPAIAEALGMRIPWRVDGQAPAAARDGARRRFSFLGPSDRIPLDPAFLRRQRRTTLRGKLVLFGSGRGGPGFYGLGSARALQGTPLSAARLGPPLEGGVSLRDEDEFSRVDSDGPFVPALVRGSVRSSDSAIESLAVVVNGRIMGSGYPVGGGDERSFEVMVDPSGFRERENRVEVLAVTRGARGVRLHRLN